MTEIDAALPPNDGLKWFNYLYWKTTQAVNAGPPSGAWEDPAGLARLDVVFASYYFQAVRDWYQAPERVPRAWRPLLVNRNRADVARIRFALTGMNAHINHDLPLAVVDTFRQSGTPFAPDGVLHRDYEQVNSILEIVEVQVKQELAVGVVGLIGEEIGKTGDVTAMWSIRKARETAWDNAMVLSALDSAALFRNAFLLSLDRLVGLAGQGLMLPPGVG